jgi:Rps23 Pro-64 3,4-dihydroxylase Tpa1-like proline 4-hydroxylase
MKTPYLLIDDWFNKEEEQLVWQELEYYSSQQKMFRGEDSVAMALKDGTPLGKHYRLHLDDIYSQRNVSNIISLKEKKFLNIEFYGLIENAFPMGRVFSQTNFDNTLLSYYEDGDDYKKHFDNVFITILIWFYKEPKLFEGGDFIFNDTNEKIQCKHNRLIAYPGYYYHSVEPVKMKTQEKFKYGRYTITHFFSNFMKK